VVCHLGSPESFSRILDLGVFSGMIDALKYCALCIQILKKNDLPEEWKKVWDTFLDLHSNKHKQKQKNS
jgi:hypothetical protein